MPSRSAACDGGYGQEAVQGTPLAGSKIYIGGTASAYKDIADMAHYDLIIAAIAALLGRWFWWPVRAPTADTPKVRRREHATAFTVLAGPGAAPTT